MLLKIQSSLTSLPLTCLAKYYCTPKLFWCLHQLLDLFTLPSVLCRIHTLSLIVLRRLLARLQNYDNVFQRAEDRSPFRTYLLTKFKAYKMQPCPEYSCHESQYFVVPSAMTTRQALRQGRMHLREMCPTPAWMISGC